MFHLSTFIQKKKKTGNKQKTRKKIVSNIYQNHLDVQVIFLVMLLLLFDGGSSMMTSRVVFISFEDFIESTTQQIFEC